MIESCDDRKLLQYIVCHALSNASLFAHVLHRIQFVGTSMLNDAHLSERSSANRSDDREMRQTRLVTFLVSSSFGASCAHPNATREGCWHGALF
ncbi:hypothetical protein PFISCL1PPCAC_10014, partial [Pristionchus fissidentatus]